MTGLGWRTVYHLSQSWFSFILSFCFIFYKVPDLTWIRSCVNFFHSYLGHGSRQEIFYDRYFISFVSVVSLVLPEEKETWEQQFLFLTIRLLHKSPLTYIFSYPSSQLKPRFFLGLATDFRSDHLLLLPFHFHLPHFYTRDFGAWSPTLHSSIKQ